MNLELNMAAFVEHRRDIMAKADDIALKYQLTPFWKSIGLECA